jgi:acyl-CoA synthetase (AMP-forming)/AMP-acid ligase II
VRLSWLNLQTSASQINQTLRNSAQDRTMVTAPIFNAYGQSIIHTMLAIGGSFVLTRARLVSREFWDAVRQTECNTIGGTPYFYEVADRLELESLDVPRLVKFAASGGRLPGHLVRKFHAIAQRRGGALHLMYGQAEATARISGLPPEYLPEASGSIGFAVPGGRLSVERDGYECGAGDEGEFIYRGANVMMGYARCQEDLAKGDGLGGKLSTGDLGYRDARGLFYITGRTSRFVKLNGWRVSLDEVEELLSDAGPIAALNENDRLVIYSERPAGALDAAVRQLASRLNLHPSGFEVRQIASIPRLANDKTDYGSLARAARGTAATGSR